jgi:hypothetical protein
VAVVEAVAAVAVAVAVAAVAAVAVAAYQLHHQPRSQRRPPSQRQRLSPRQPKSMVTTGKKTSQRKRPLRTALQLQRRGHRPRRHHQPTHPKNLETAPVSSSGSSREVWSSHSSAQ